MVNSSNTASDAFNPYGNKPDSELKTDLTAAITAGNYDEANKIMDELKSRTWEQDKLHLVKSFDQTIEEFRDSLNGLSEDEKNQKLTTFFENDLKTYQSKLQNEHIPAIEARDKEIQRLQAMLWENAMDLPTLKEYLSPKTRSLSNLNQKIQKFKADKEHYPKNFLIYAMGMTNTDLFWVGKTLKRNQIKFLWKRKSEYIGEMLKILDDKLKDQSSDKNWTKTMKYHLRKELQLAKEEYINQQKKKVYGTAA